LVSAPSRLSQVAGWGGVMTAVGVLVARTGSYGPGRTVELAGTAVASLGSAVVCGVALEVITEMRLVTGWRRIVAGVGVVAAMALVVSTVLVFLPGRAGLPSDSLTGAVRFTEVAEGNPSMSRFLLVGPPDTLPGASRVIEGAAYRVASAPMPALWEVDMPQAAGVDEALADALRGLITGDSFRAGADLAQFGIRWVIFTGDSPFQAVFASQLDMVPLQGLDLPTYVSDADGAVRLVPSTGWDRDGTGYVGTAGASGRAFAADTANSRWTPDWQPASWGNEMSTVDGTIGFAPIAARRSMGLVALGLFTVMLGASVWGRRAR
jgi:VanZ family protein